MTPHLEVVGLTGIPEVHPGADLADLIARAVRPHRPSDGDVLAVTSKVVAKAEGRLRVGVPRDEVIDAETTEVVAEWAGPTGRTVVGRTTHGYVLAAAGVDASNVELGTLVLLPSDPDASARRLRAALLERLRLERLGVVVTDTMGRAWREGLVDVAVGCAGLSPVLDLRGQRDAYGNELTVTVVALADEVAAASELARPKLAGVPAALVRGLGAHVTTGDGPGAAALIRPPQADRFPLGAREAVRAALRAYATGRPAIAPTVDGLAQAVAAVQAALPDVRLAVRDGEVGLAIDVDAPDADSAAEARALLRVAMLGEGFPPPT